MNGNQHNEPRTRTVGILLGAILLIAAILRFLGIGDLGFWIDEDLTWLATQGILAEGVPRLPSGEVYGRGLPYSYLVAGASSILGADEFGLRIPSLLFSLGTILVVFALLRPIIGPRAGLIGAAIMALSPWEHHYAQMARMYALLALLFTGTILFASRAFFGGSRGALAVACLLAFLAVPTHQLGATLALVFLVPVLLARRPRWGFTLAGLASIVASKVLFRLIDKSDAFADRGGLRGVFDIGSSSAGIQIPFLPGITFNHSRFICGDLIETFPAVGIAVAVGLLLAAAVFLVRLFRARTTALGMIMLLVFVSLLCLNQLVLSALVGLIALKIEGDRGGQLAALLRGMITITVVATALLFIGQLASYGIEGVLDRQFLRLFFAMPVPFYRLLALHHPGMMLVTLIGSIFILRDSFVPEASQRAVYLLAIFVSLLLLMGLFRSPYTINRYTFYLNPLFVALFVISLTRITHRLAEWIEARRQRQISAPEGSRPPHWLSPAIFAILFIATADQFDPLQTWAATSRSYGYDTAPITDPDLRSHFHYDYKGCGEYLREHGQADDLYIAKEPVELYPYGVRCELRINELYSVYARRNDSGDPVDWYLGIPIASGLAELERELETAARKGRTAWIVYTRRSEEGPAIHLPAEILDFLERTRLAGEANGSTGSVHTARDGLTTILRFDP